MPSPVKDSQVSVRLPNELKERMEVYARLTGRTKSHVAMEALNDYLDWRIPQIEDLKAAVQAADAGEFADDAAVQAVFGRYDKTPKASRGAAMAPATRSGGKSGRPRGRA